MNLKKYAPVLNWPIAEAAMRIADASILIVPGGNGARPDHWLSRWQNRLKTAQLVEQADWAAPRLADWLNRLTAAFLVAPKPIVIIAHGLGVALVAHAAGAAAGVAGAFLVAPVSDEAIAANPQIDPGFAPVPRAPLPFHAHVVASSNDPWCPLPQAQAMAAQWGATIADAGAIGHIDDATGHGPWPEGLMSFGGFMGRL
jgi:predicted alpha/beta hydrolase family esterase